MLLSRAVSPFTVVAEMKVSSQEEMANLQDIKVFVIEIQGLLEYFVSFHTTCGVQSSPPVFAPDCTFVCGSLQGQSPGETLCVSLRSSELSAQVRRQNYCICCIHT